MQIERIEIAESIGLRDYMEDAHCVQDLNSRFFSAFVFDGHGGADAAIFLKKYFSTALKQIPKDVAIDDIPLLVRRLIRDLHLVFVKNYNMQGSTICGCIVDKLNNVIFVVNLGDSQLTMYGPQGKMLYISKKDTTDDPLARQHLAKLGIKVSRLGGVWRMEDVLNLTKAFGDLGYSQELDTALRKLKAWDPRVDKIALTQKCTRITIATDGLFDEIPAELYSQVPFLRKLPIQDLASFVAEKGTKGDNVTIVSFDIMLR